MQLDYIESTRCFTLKVPRRQAFGEAELFKSLMTEHGLDFSKPDSTAETAVLFTREPYAAAAFWNVATERAQAQLRDIQEQVELSWRIDADRHIDVPADKALAGFQKAGVDYALRRQNTLIGDQPGLGKTMQAIAFANEIKAKKVLVICPANIRLQWWARIQAWTTMPWPYTIHAILNGRHGVNPDANWTLVSYDLARTAPIWSALARETFDLLVLDEAHYLKSIDALRTRTVFGGGAKPEAAYLSSRAGATLALSGTPLPNRPREAYTLARGLCFDAIDFASEDRFKFRFNPSVTNETPDGKVWVDERAGRAGELQARLRANFMVRRLKRDVLPQLKLPYLDIVHVEETKAVKAALKAESLLDIDPENLEGLRAEIFGHVSVVRREMGVAIAPLAADYADMLLDGGEEKLVLFAWHTEVLDILQKKLALYSPLRIDGSTPPSRKQAIVEAFKQPSKRLLLGNILSLGTGTDGLQEVCQRGVAAEASWTAGDNEQMIDRLDRMGQEGQVQFDFLVAKGSFSERVLGSSLQKRRVTHNALDRVILPDVSDW